MAAKYSEEINPEGKYIHLQLLHFLQSIFTVLRESSEDRY